MAETKLVNVDEQVIGRVNELCQNGLIMPKDYNYVNAIKASFIKLQELTDKNGKPALEVCTKISIVNALFKMVTMGLDMSKNQCYPIVRGNRLCLDPSYYGKVRMVRRKFPKWEPHPQVIRQGDVFQYEINPETGCLRVLKHEQKFENRDNPEFVGGYLYLPNEAGTLDCYLMTKKQIMTAWSKSSSKEHLVHKQFDEKMIGKTLINSGCNMIINAYPDFFNMEEDVEDEKEVNYKTSDLGEEFQEAVEVHDVVQQIESDDKKEPEAPIVVEQQPSLEEQKETANVATENKPIDDDEF